MSEPTPAPVEPKPTEPTPQGGELSPEAKGLLRDLQAQRESNKALKEQLEAIEKANEEAEKARLEKNEDYKQLLEKANAKVNEYEPVVNEYNAYKESRKAALLEQLGEDADDFSGLDIPALEKVVAKLTTQKQIPKEPGRPGLVRGTYSEMSYGELSVAISRGDTKAREELEIRNQQGKL